MDPAREVPERDGDVVFGPGAIGRRKVVGVREVAGLLKLLGEVVHCLFIEHGLGAQRLVLEEDRGEVHLGERVHEGRRKVRGVDDLLTLDLHVGQHALLGGVDLPEHASGGLEGTDGRHPRREGEPDFGVVRVVARRGGLHLVLITQRRHVYRLAVRVGIGLLRMEVRKRRRHVIRLGGPAQGAPFKEGFIRLTLILQPRVHVDLGAHKSVEEQAEGHMCKSNGQGVFDARAYPLHRRGKRGSVLAS
eukprot:scaffold84200_cov61-Phaeocystis_antarctica.AAC.4